jgi:aspartyl protease family protein
MLYNGGVCGNFQAPAYSVTKRNQIIMTQPDPRLAKVMVYLSWILLVLLLTWLFSETLDRQHNPNRDPQSRSVAGAREISLQRNRQGHYVVTGAINDEPVVFLLDTGATHVSVPVAVARRLGLQPGRRVLMQTANGVIAVQRTTLDRVAIGDVGLSNVTASINPHQGGEQVLLGMAFLKQVELVQRGQTLIIRQR